MAKIKFTCAHCNKEFESDQDDEEARAEYERRFGGLGAENKIRVCLPCYQLAMIDYKVFEQIVHMGGLDKTHS